MKEIAQELRSEIDGAMTALRPLTEAEVTASRGPGKWIKKEILGHLIDSAANNLQRFVRAHLGESYAGPGYEQDGWVSVQRYRNRPWTDLLDLWGILNRHVAHAMESVPASKGDTRCVIGDGDPVTLDWLMRDYLRHMRHHLAQLLS